MKFINEEDYFMSKEIHTNKAPEAIGPYSQAIEAGDFIYLSGAIPLDPETGEIAEGITNQTVQVMENLKAILTESGTDFSHVVKFTSYLATMEDFATGNEVYGDYLEQPYPARSSAEVSLLTSLVSIAIDAIIYKKSKMWLLSSCISADSTFIM